MREKNTNSAGSTSDQKAKHDKRDWNAEYDDSRAQRPDCRGHGYIERLAANVLCCGTFECSIELVAASHAHPDEQYDPIN
jgi:hypothetical protein